MAKRKNDHEVDEADEVVAEYSEYEDAVQESSGERIESMRLLAIRHGWTFGELKKYYPEIPDSDIEAAVKEHHDARAAERRRRSNS